jgi:hypothetical protein
MKITTFIQNEIFLPRLKQNGGLIVYDPYQRYRELCLELNSEKLRVIDTSESSITSRFAALDALNEFGQPNPSLEGILIYVPAKAPVTDEEKQRDPFAIYGACGAVFPEGDGDEYLSLCLKARADYATEIRRIFKDNPNPSFAVIDAIGGGAGWPNLQALLKVESARDILFALLAPSEIQKEALKNQTTWLSEATALFQSTLGLNLKTKIKTWTALADELWRFLLFSEFVFDLPGDLPPALTNVPCAPQEAFHLVEDLCDRLRNDRRTQAFYIERAEGIEKELNLPAICEKIDDFGVRDTFPFEERACFNQAVDALKRDNVDRLRSVLNRHEQSVWISRGENQAQWALLHSAASLAQTCEDADRQLSEHTRTLDTLLDFYTSSMREVDRLQREFEQAAGDLLDSGGPSIEVIRQSRSTYRRLIDKVHGVFVRHIEKSGWPVSGRLSNVDVFDKLVAPKLLESGRRVAYLLIDAMRYELGVELAKHLIEAGQVEVQVACAQMPTVTPVGMAAILPEAGQNLKLLNKDSQLLTVLGDQPLTSVAQRMDTLRKRYGQRFTEMDLVRFVRDNPKIDSTVELLVIRSNDMDNDFEANPEAAPGLISRTFQKIRSAIFKLRDLGFQDVIIVTDHGFFLNTAIEPGDVCAKPSGRWINVHERTLLGDGIGDTANLVLPAETLGIQGEYNQVAIPRALVAYRAGQWYFHGGLSLQEAIVPVITVKIRAAETGISSKLLVMLNYKRGSKKITTRLPVIELEAGASDLFAQETDVLIEAYDAKGNVVGEAKPGGPVNPATRIITLKPGDTIPITLKMDLDFEGKFVVKALDPITQTALGKPLELETDYTV